MFDIAPESFWIILQASPNFLVEISVMGCLLRHPITDILKVVSPLCFSDDGMLTMQGRFYHCYV